MENFRPFRSRMPSPPDRQPASVKQPAGAGRIVCQRGGRVLVPFRERRRKQLGGRHIGIPEQRCGHRRTVQGHAQCPPDPHVAKDVVARVDLEQDCARQGHLGDGEPACLLQALQAGRVHAESDVRLSALGHQCPALGPPRSLVVDLGDRRFFTLPLLERRQLDVRRLFQPLDPVWAGPDDLRHGPIGGVGAGGENLRAGVGQHCGKRRKRLRQVHPYRPAVGGDGSDGDRRQRCPGLPPGGLQRAGDRLCRDRGPVVEQGIRAEREPPGEFVRGRLPAGSKPGLQAAPGIGINQGFGNLQPGEEPAVRGRVQAVQLKLPHHLQWPLRCPAVLRTLTGARPHQQRRGD